MWVIKMEHALIFVTSWVQVLKSAIELNMHWRGIIYISNDKELEQRNIRPSTMTNHIFIHDRVSGDALARAGFNVIK